MVGLVRPDEIDDAAAIARVHVVTWRTASQVLLPDDFVASLDEVWYAERWRRTLGDPSGRVYIAEAAGAVVGFASGGRERAGEDGYEGELYPISVLDEPQGPGPGRRPPHALPTRPPELPLRVMIA